jgi:predicted nucleic acid-binding protein
VRYLLDTSVLLAFGQTSVDKGLLDWLDATPEHRLYLSVISLGELQQGISVLPISADRQHLQTWLDEGLRVRFGERLLNIGSEEGLLWGHLRSKHTDKRLSAVDGLIAATALYHRLVLVTAQSERFSWLSELQVINPFTGK